MNYEYADHDSDSRGAIDLLMMAELTWRSSCHFSLTKLNPRLLRSIQEKLS